MQDPIPTPLILRDLEQPHHIYLLPPAQLVLQHIELLLVARARKVQQIIDLVLRERSGHRRRSDVLVFLEIEIVEPRHDGPTLKILFIFVCSAIRMARDDPSFQPFSQGYL
jgi:hypothetical protein